MKTKIASLAAAAAFVALTPAAFAADMPVAAPPVQAMVPEEASFDWTGFYVGAYGGYAFGESNVDGLGESDIEGALAGGTVGYNQQYGQFVLGIEADGGWSGADNDDDAATYDADIGWLSTVRGRVGYSFDSFMIYGTGGAAIGEVNIDDGVTDESDTRLGWTAGAGVEAALTDNISVKGEYLYVDLGDEELGGSDVDINAHTVRGGINYRF
ncbi:membrane protein [Terrihabitans soli]|uniref:Membrane protein n=1 Tax=Terrihabitans soli TaxID=708113 RepID=A0A6S6QS75_9HYPH|nr:outer membrane protein [Terrihabitans soli]BCJ90132.1 membrane protein [Terrihabitans soli]